METWERWRDAVEGEGLAFTAAEEYTTFPPSRGDSGTWRSAADAAIALLPLMEDFRPDVVVSDILTLAPTLAAERVGVNRATLIPHVYPVHEPGLPFFAFGMQPPRTPVGRAVWRGAQPVLESGLRRGRDEMNETRAAVGLPTVESFHGGISRELAMVATFPQLEYPRRWPAGVNVTGPMQFELPYPNIELPEGNQPLVLVAPSTAQDPELRLVRTALEALTEEPVRVVATTNRLDPAPVPAAPGNAVVVDWLSYSQVMPQASLVICHGGHGTVARALAAGVPVLCCPHVGDMAENAARVAWAGAGLMLPWRLLATGPLRVASRRILGDESLPASSRRARGLVSGERRRGARSPPGRAASRSMKEAGICRPPKLRGRDSNPQPSR